MANRNRFYTHTSQAAFTMLELAIVIVIIGVVMGMGMMSTDKVLQTARRSATESKMDVIENALMAFRLKYDRLPCPADITATKGNADYGVEAIDSVDSSRCRFLASSGITGTGSVPVKTLGLPEEYVLDGWGHKFRYNAMAGGLPFFDMKLGVYRGDASGIQVRSVPNTSDIRSDGAAYALVSYGSNGYGAYNQDGTQNSSTGASAREVDNISAPVYQGDVNSDGVGEFDDVLRFKERWQMATPADRRVSPEPIPTLIVARTGGAVLLTTHFFAGYNMSNDYNTGISGVVTAVAFTGDNKHIFLYGSASPYCSLMRIFRTSYPANPSSSSSPISFVSVPSAVPNCSGYDNNSSVALSKDGYLAISQGDTNVINLWKLSGDRFIALPTVTAAGTVGRVVFTENSDMMLAAYETAGIAVYKRNASGTGYVEMANQPTGASLRDATISPNGKLVVGVSRTNPVRLYVWGVENDGTFSDLHVVTPITTSAVNFVSPVFSPDSRYLVYGSTANGHWWIARINDDLTFDSFSTAIPLTIGITPEKIAFHKSSRYAFPGLMGNLLTRKSGLEFINTSGGITNIDAAAFSY